MKTTFSRNKTETEFYHDNGGNILGDVVVLGQSQKIAREMNIPRVDNHNWGFVPVLFMPNLPNNTVLGDATMKKYPDANPSIDELRTLQGHIDDILDAIKWELKYNMTFILAALTPQAQQN